MNGRMIKTKFSIFKLIDMAISISIKRKIPAIGFKIQNKAYFISKKSSTFALKLLIRDVIPQKIQFYVSKN